MKPYIVLGLILVIGGGGFYLLRKMYGFLSGFSRTVFGTKYLLEGIQRQTKQLETTPKSVSGMTKIFLPQIEKDFPEFNWVEFRHKTENMLVAFLTAVDTGNPEILEAPSAELKQQLVLRLEGGKQRRIQEHYHNIKVHQTEIAGYRKQNGTCVLTMQSSLGYYHYEETLQGEVVAGEKDRMEQTKYNTELVYIQDIEKLKDQTTGVGVTCQNCGAPVTKLGSKYCEYCGTGIREINLRVWALNKIYEL